MTRDSHHQKVPLHHRPRLHHRLHPPPPQRRQRRRLQRPLPQQANLPSPTSRVEAAMPPTMPMDARSNKLFKKRGKIHLSIYLFIPSSFYFPQRIPPLFRLAKCRPCVFFFKKKKKNFFTGFVQVAFYSCFYFLSALRRARVSFLRFLCLCFFIFNLRFLRTLDMSIGSRVFGMLREHKQTQNRTVSMSKLFSKKKNTWTGQTALRCLLGFSTKANGSREPLLTFTNVPAID